MKSRLPAVRPLVSLARSGELLVLATLLSGCQIGHENPLLPHTAMEARSELGALRSSPPDTGQRPLIILSGWRDPGIGPARVAPALRDLVGHDRVLTVNFFTGFSFPFHRQRVVDAVQARWPSNDPDRTVEVDVIGHSMGGLVGRYAAIPAGADGFAPRDQPTGRRLNIRTLYTVSSPHRGAQLAPLACVDRSARDMMVGSNFIAALDRHHTDAGYRLLAYMVKGDLIVGDRNCAPATAPDPLPRRWLPRRLPLPSHLNALGDPRVTLAIANDLTRNVHE